VPPVKFRQLDLTQKGDAIRLIWGGAYSGLEMCAGAFKISEGPQHFPGEEFAAYCFHGASLEISPNRVVAKNH